MIEENSDMNSSQFRKQGNFKTSTHKKSNRNRESLLGAQSNDDVNEHRGDNGGTSWLEEKYSNDNTSVTMHGESNSNGNQISKHKNAMNVSSNSLKKAKNNS